MSAAGTLLCCTCGCVAPCAGSAVRKTMCTGKCYVRTNLTLIGEVNGSGSATGQFNITDGNDAKHYDITGSVAAIVSVDFTRLTTENIGMGISVEGVHSYNPTTGQVFVDTLALFGSASITSHALSGTLTDIDGNVLASGDATTDNISVTVSGGISVDKDTGEATATMVFSVGVGGQWENTNAPDLPYGANVSAGFSGTYTWTVDLDDLCDGEAITTPYLTRTGSGGVSMAGADSAVDGTSSSDWDGDGSVTGQHLTDDIDEYDDPLSGRGCSRFLNVAAHVDRPTGHSDIAGRVRMAAAVKCGQYAIEYRGGGIITSPISIDSSTLVETAVGLTLNVDTIGLLGSAGYLVMDGWGGTVIVAAGSSSGVFYIQMNGGVTTAGIAIGAAASAVRTALEAILPTATVRVQGTGMFTGSPAINPDPYLISIVYPDGSFPSTLYAYASFTGTGTIASDYGTYTGSSALMAMRFSSSGKCLEAGTLTPGGSESTAPVPNGYFADATLSVSETARIDGDPSYYCDCGPNCESAPSSLGITIASPAVGTHPAISIAFILPKLTGTPCVYDGTFRTDGSAITTDGDDFAVTIRVDSTGRFILKVFDDEGTTIATFKATCGAGQSVASLTWKLESTAAVWAPYTALAVTT